MLVKLRIMLVLLLISVCFAIALDADDFNINKSNNPSFSEKALIKMNLE